ncbi:MAG: helix-turn-helix domain-containing protein [Treponemataceae bacterium]
MQKQTLGMMISSLRKAKEMTQLELAEKMNVTDKAVSKWERDLSCPDINSLSKLAQELDVSVNDLIQCNKITVPQENKIEYLTTLILKAVSLAMGVAVTVLSILDKLDSEEGIALLGIGLTCAGLSLLKTEKKKPLE